VNDYLLTHGYDMRIDHRSLKDQGIDRAPATHLGPAVTEMHRRGMHTQVIERIREQQRLDMQARLERAAEAGRLAREAHDLDRSILDLSGDIAAAKAERKRALKSEWTRGQRHGQSAMDHIDAVRRQAAERWWKSRQLNGPTAGQGVERGRSHNRSHIPDRSLDGPEDDYEL
jgi:hypothetical protein